jgi:hypothetical protein
MNVDPDQLAIRDCEERNATIERREEVETRRCVMSALLDLPYKIEEAYVSTIGIPTDVLDQWLVQSACKDATR